MTGLEDQLHYESLEQRILGGISVQQDIIKDISQYLKPNMFTNKKLGKIYGLCIQLYAERVQIDEINVTHLARKKPSLGIQMADIIDAFRTASPLDATIYSKAVAERWIKIQVKKIADRASSDSERENANAFELLQDLISKLEAINEGYEFEQGAQSLSEMSEEMIEYMMEATEGIPSGVPSGLTEVDELTNGFQKGDLYIIGARPAMGKSALATTFIKNAADQGYPAAISSLEMKKYKVFCRLVSEDIQLFVGDLVKRNLSKAQMEYFAQAVAELVKNKVIVIDDNQDMSIDQLRAKAREWKRKYGIQILVVDYLQLMDGDTNQGNREQEIARISRGLKKIAKELDIPVIALAQLSRAVEQRDNKRPMMSDLRESGGIEQDADAIFFLYRPEYYAQIAGQECPPEFKGMCQLIIGKFRDDESSDILLRFVGEYSVFRDREDLNVNLHSG